MITGESIKVHWRIYYENNGKYPQRRPIDKEGFDEMDRKFDHSEIRFEKASEALEAIRKWMRQHRLNPVCQSIALYRIHPHLGGQDEPILMRRFKEGGDVIHAIRAGYYH